MTTTLSGKWVFDTHLFVYALDQQSPFHKKALQLFSQIQQNIIFPVTTQQNIIEAGRVLILAYKISPKKAAQSIENILISFNIQIISPLATTYLKYHKLVIKYPKPADLFDYYLAATILDNNLKNLLTLNTKDFSSIKEIHAVNPFN